MLTPEQKLIARQSERNAKLAALDTIRKSVGLSCAQGGQYDALKRYSLSDLADMGIIN